jgi:hypothetical protein
MNVNKMVENFKEAEKLIRLKQKTDPKTDSDILFHWILKTEANLYQVFERDVADICSKIENLVDLYHEIHHALEDDGDLTLVNISSGKNNYFMVIFDSPTNYKDFKVFSDRVKNNYPEHSLPNFEIKTEVNIFEGNIKDFVEAAEHQHVKKIKKCYLMDASRFGASHAKKHYEKYECFDEDWKDEVFPIEEKLKIKRHIKF